MREIKFRAWDKKTNKMINHIRNIDFALGKIMNEYDLDIVNGQNSGNQYRGFEHIELMQYTGLKDENKKQIFDGDKILDGYGDTLYVEFSNGAFWFMYDKDNGYTYDWIVKQEGTFRAKVIGNIYENPELHNEEKFMNALTKAKEKLTRIV